MTTGQQTWVVTLESPLSQLAGLAEFNRIISDLGGTVVSSPAILPAASISLPTGASPDPLLVIPGVLSVEPDRLAGVEQGSVPLSRPVPLATVGPQVALNYRWPLRMVKADQVQNQGNLASGVRVAVLDTGVNTDHPEFTGVQFIANESFVGGESPSDNHGHGTAVTGMIAGQGVQLRGVAPAAHIANLRVMDRDGLTSTSILLAALDRAATLQCQVVNMSLGFLNRFDAVPSLEAALKVLAEMGIICIAAAGNEGYTDQLPMPARSRYTIAVGAVSQSGVIPSWSNSAPWPGSPECIAPGEDVPVVWYQGDYATMSGTSIACPMVAGAVGLFLSAGAVKGNGQMVDCPKYQDLAPESVASTRLVLRASGVVLPTPTINHQGYGLLDSLAGVSTAVGEAGDYQAGDLTVESLTASPSTLPEGQTTALTLGIGNPNLKQGGFLVNLRAVNPDGGPGATIEQFADPQGQAAFQVLISYTLGLGLQLGHYGYEVNLYSQDSAVLIGQGSFTEVYFVEAGEPLPANGEAPVEAPALVLLGAFVELERNLAKALFAPLFLFSPLVVPPPGPLETLDTLLRSRA